MEPTEWRPLSQVSDDDNPCTRCGACCAFFRVEFFWREAENVSEIGIDAEYQVPIQLTEELDSFRRCMGGTSKKKGNQCVALCGRVGEKVSCGIYQNRPSPCRAFEASFAKGKLNKKCNEARLAHGMKPLKASDWKS